MKNTYIISEKRGCKLVYTLWLKHSKKCMGNRPRGIKIIC